MPAFVSHQGSFHYAESMRSLRGVRSPDAHPTHNISQRGALGEWIVLRTRTQMVLEQLDLDGADEKRRHEWLSQLAHVTTDSPHLRMVGAPGRRQRCRLRTDQAQIRRRRHPESRRG